MLEPYRFRKASIHRVHSFVNYLFLEIICQARKRTETAFSPTMATRYEHFLNDLNSKYLLVPLQEIYAICRSLPPQDLKIIRRALHVNNRVRELCQGQFQPVLYRDLEAINPNLAQYIRQFCNNLYKHVLRLAPAREQFGDIDEYYRQFIRRDSYCRFCGLGTVHTKFSSKRSAFDHYLPQSIYPFVSVNFHNLVPTCHTCNEDYKDAQNPLFHIVKRGRKIVSEERVKVFYPFRRNTPSIQVAFALKRRYYREIVPDEIDVQITCSQHQEETDVWKRIYGIEERYKEVCCSDQMFGFIENQFLASKISGLNRKEYRGALGKDTRKFLEVAFLEATEEIYYNEHTANAAKDI